MADGMSGRTRAGRFDGVLLVGTIVLVAGVAIMVDHREWPLAAAGAATVLGILVVVGTRIRAVVVGDDRPRPTERTPSARLVFLIGTVLAVLPSAVVGLIAVVIAHGNPLVLAVAGLFLGMSFAVLVLMAAVWIGRPPP